MRAYGRDGLRWALAAILMALSACSGSDDDDDDDTITVDDDDDIVDDDDDDQPVNPPREAYNTWIKIEPEGAHCANGSPFKFFVNFSETSSNLLVEFQGGGACWEWNNCSPEGPSQLGAMNTDGIPDEHMTGGSGLPWGVSSPLLVRNYYQDTPTSDWNLVFVPYCTGDINTGNSVRTYEDPLGVGTPIEFRHEGYSNVSKVIAWMGENFKETVPQLLVSGCSAGGFAANINYFRLRDALPAERGYLLNDSGPIFPRSPTTAPLFDTVTESWNLESIMPEECEGCLEDQGNFHKFLAERYPDDRLATTVFRRDFNVSRFYFEEFIDNPTKEHIHEVFNDNLLSMISRFEEHDNLAYYVPYWRELNDSHCVSIISYGGTEIQEADLNLRDYLWHLLDDRETLQSYIETPQPDEDLPPEP